jgi:hypothetical protein
MFSVFKETSSLSDQPSIEVCCDTFLLIDLAARLGDCGVFIDKSAALEIFNAFGLHRNLFVRPAEH